MNIKRGECSSFQIISYYAESVHHNDSCIDPLDKYIKVM